MKIFKMLSRVVALAGVIVLLGNQAIAAVSVSQLGVPLDAADVPAATVPGSVESFTAMPGDWTTASADMGNGQEMRIAGYDFPPLNVCEQAPITALTVNIPTTTVTLNATVTTQEWIGIQVAVRSKNTPFAPVNVAAVTSGTRLDGASAASLDPNFSNYMIVRGFTNPGWTTTTTLIPGAIQFDVDTTGMTVADYHELAVTVGHDLYDGPLSTHADDITSAQPIITVTADETVCNTGTTEGATPQPPVQETLPNTGQGAFAYIAIAAALIGGGIFSAVLLKRNTVVKK